MDKRYQVFVSSTYVDLTDERQAVIQTLLEMDCIPAGMELFPASDDEQWSLIKRALGAVSRFIASNAFSDRYSCTKPTTELRTTMAAIVMVSVCGSPCVYAETKAMTVATRSIMTKISLN